MSAKLPLSSKIFPITHPAMFTLMTMASLWFVDFNLKSSSVKVISTLAHSGHIATKGTLNLATRTCLNCVPRVSSFELPISARPHSSTSGTPLSRLPV
jgi:hypothetical protein